LTASSAKKFGTSIAQYVNKAHNMSVQSIEIMRNLPRETISAAEMLISANLYLDDNAAGVVIFTSGTTGPPKGAVMRRAFVHDSAMAVAEHYGILHNDVILHVLPVHHATGIGISFFPFILVGACIEFKSGSFDPGWMWERWRQGGLTFFSGVPTVYMRMMRFYDQHLVKLPQRNQAQYVHGVNQIRAMLCGSSALPKPVQDFWTGIRNGKIILTRYGATEFGAVFKVPVDAKGVPHGSVGTAVAGIDVKLSEGNEGEILVKSPYMFSKYVPSLLPLAIWPINNVLDTSSTTLPRCLRMMQKAISAPATSVDVKAATTGL
jgi:malonyl-CoA/methylmalonyl-CoA synthetase